MSEDLEEKIQNWMDLKKNAIEVPAELKHQYKEYLHIETLLKQRSLPKGNPYKIISPIKKFSMYLKIATALLVFSVYYFYPATTQSQKPIDWGIIDTTEEDSIEKAVYETFVIDWSDIEKTWGNELPKSQEPIDVIKESCHETWNQIQFFMENYVDTSHLSDKPG